MSKLWQATRYANYLLRCIHLHGIHSPFVFQLNEKVFQAKIPYYAFDKIESLRAKLQLTEKKIKATDLGAGSQKNNAKTRKISEIAKTALKSPQKAQLLYRLVRYFQPETILELGTSFGITTSYLAKANPKAKVITMEGSEEISKIATVNFKKLKIENIDQVIGNFDLVFETVLKNNQKIDLIYFDGNHKKTPTLNYFKQALNFSHEDSIFIFDDIYWSEEMTAAWKEIKKHPYVRITIDLFEFGIVFFKKDQAKEHFTVYH